MESWNTGFLCWRGQLRSWSTASVRDLPGVSRRGIRVQSVRSCINQRVKLTAFGQVRQLKAGRMKRPFRIQSNNNPIKEGSHRLPPKPSGSHCRGIRITIAISRCSINADSFCQAPANRKEDPALRSIRRNEITLHLPGDTYEDRSNKVPNQFEEGTEHSPRMEDWQHYDMGAVRACVSRDSKRDNGKVRPRKCRRDPSTMDCNAILASYPEFQTRR